MTNSDSRGLYAFWVRAAQHVSLHADKMPTCATDLIIIIIIRRRPIMFPINDDLFLARFHRGDGFFKMLLFKGFQAFLGKPVFVCLEDFGDAMRLSDDCFFVS